MGSGIKVSKSVILFDGYCNFCNSQVNSILRFDSKKFFYFSNLDSSFSKKVIKENKVESLEGKTIILYHNNKYFESPKQFYKKFLDRLQLRFIPRN